MFHGGGAADRGAHLRLGHVPQARRFIRILHKTMESSYGPQNAARRLRRRECRQSASCSAPGAAAFHAAIIKISIKKSYQNAEVSWFRRNASSSGTVFTTATAPAS